MKVQFALLADAANKTDSGKLNLLGVFDRINARQFPALHPSGTLVMRLVFSTLETGKEHGIRIVLVDEDGKELMAQEGKLNLGPRKGPDAYADMIVPLMPMPFPTAGNYQLRILVDESDLFSVSLLLQTIEEKSKND